MTLNELIEELQKEQSTHGSEEIGYEVSRTKIDILIGEDENTGVCIAILKPDWNP